MKIKKLLSKRGMFFVYHCFMYIVIYFSLQLIDKKGSKIWLISERSDEARDNGYHMFKYIRENYPDVKIYYVIQKNCRDRIKVENYGNVINFGSLKHILYYFLAERHISTHINGCYPNEKSYFILNKKFNINAKVVFLQHGITKDYIKGATKDFANLDLFVCGAYPEYNYVLENFGHPNEVVKYLGMARFDNLHDLTPGNKILLMPTFRMNLFVYFDDVIDEKMERDFIDSTYYKTYQSLINNHQLELILEKNNLELLFYPHYEIQRYLHLFKTNNERIIIADRNNYDIQALLKEAKLLITDYSSVYFDFAYMQKPIIYYQFDYEEYRKIHYNEGYFSYEETGFGPIVKTENDLLSNLVKIEENGFVMNDFYINRSKDFFNLNDENNRERNYRAILDL